MAAGRYSAGSVFVQVVPSFKNMQRRIAQEVEQANRDLAKSEEARAEQTGDRVGHAHGDAQGKARAQEQKRYLDSERKAEEAAAKARVAESKRQDKEQFDARLQMAKEQRRADIRDTLAAEASKRKINEAAEQARNAQALALQKSRLAAEESAQKSSLAKQAADRRAAQVAQTAAERRATLAHAENQKRRTADQRVEDQKRLTEHRMALQQQARMENEARAIKRQAEREAARQAEKDRKAALDQETREVKAHLDELNRAHQASAGARGRAIRKAMHEALQAIPPVDITTNSTKADRDIDRLRSHMMDLGNAHIGLNIDADEAESRVRYIRQQVDSLKRRAGEGEHLQINTESAIGSLRKLDDQVERSLLRQRTLADEYRTFQPLVLGLAAVLPAVPQLAAVGAAGLGILTTAAATAGTSIAATVAGFSGIGEAVKALSKQQDNAAKNAQAAAKQQQQAAAQVATAQDGVRSAQQRLVDQRRSVVEAQAAVGKAQRDAARAASDAARRVVDAQASVKKAVQDAAQANQDAARAVKDAQAGVREAHRDAADAVRKAQRDVSSAERALQDTQRASKDAQRALNDARREAVQDLADMNRELARGRLDERQAVLDVKDAEAELKKARKTGNKDDIERALIRLERQKLTLKDTRAQNKNLAIEKARADKAGVKGSEKVRNAQQRVNDAIQSQRDAQQRLVDAQRGVTTARVEGAQKIAKAERTLSDAMRAQVRTQRDGQASVAKARRDLSDAMRDQGRVAEDNAERIRGANKRVADSQRGVADAQRALTRAQQQLSAAIAAQKAGPSMSADALKTKQAMEDLSPAGRRFAKYLMGIKEDFKGIRNTIQQGMIPGVQKSMEELRKAYGPGMKRFAGTMGRVLGSEFGKMGKWLQSPVWKKFFAMMEKYTPVFTRLFFSIGKNLAEVFAGVATAFAPLTKDFLGWLDKASKGWAKWAKGLDSSDGFKGFVKFVKDNAPILKDFFKSLGKALVEIGKAGAPVGVSWIKGMTKLLEVIAKIPEPILTGMLYVMAGVATMNQIASGSKIAKEAMGTSYRMAVPAPVRETIGAHANYGRKGAGAATQYVRDAPTRYAAGYQSTRMMQRNAMPAVPKTQLNKIGMDFSQGFANGIAKGIGNVTAASRRVGSASLSGLKNAIRSKSPSKLTNAIGLDFIAGFRNAITSGAAGVATAASRVGASAAAALRKSAAPTKGAQAAAALPPVAPVQRASRGQRAARVAGPAAGVAMGGLMLGTMIGGDVGEKAGTAMTAVMGLSMALSAIPSGAVSKAGKAMKAASMAAVSLAKNVALSAAAFIKQGVQAALAGVRMLVVKTAQLAIAVATKVWTVAQWLLNAALMANPLGLVVIAVVAVIAAFVLAYKKIGWFRDGVNAAWGGIKGAAVAVFNWFKDIFQNHWKTILLVLTGPFGLAVIAIRALFDSKSGLRSVLRKMWEWMKGIFKATWAGVRAIITAPISLAKAVISKLFDRKSGIRSIFRKLWEWMKGIFKATWAGLRAIITAPISLARAAISRLFDRKSGIRSVFRKLWEWMKGIFKATWAGLRAIVTTPIRLARAAISKLFDRRSGIRSIFRKLWEWMKGIFRVTWARLKAIVTSPISLARAAISKLFDRRSGIRSIFRKLWEWMKGSFKRTWRGLSAFITAPIRLAKAAISKLFGRKSGIRSIFRKLWEWMKGSFKGAWNKLGSILSGPIKSTVTFINEKIVDPINSVLPGNPIPRIPGGRKKKAKGKADGGQVLPGRAEGGPIPRRRAGGIIPGPWKGPKADNVLGLDTHGAPTALVNPLEFIHPVAAVKHYGLNAMEAVRKRQALIIPNGMAPAFSAGGQPMRGGLPRHAKGGYVGANKGRLGLKGKLITLGRKFQKMGIAVGQHSRFGGNPRLGRAGRSYGSLHGWDLALDINGRGEGNGQFDKLARSLWKQGWGVQWKSPGHYDHMHVDTGLLGRRFGQTRWQTNPNASKLGGTGGLDLSGAGGDGADFSVFSAVAKGLGKFVKKLGIGTSNIGTQTLGGLFKSGADKVISNAKKQYEASMLAMGAMPGPLGGVASAWNKITGKGLGRIKNAVKKAFEPYGWHKGAQWKAADWLIGKESSWRPTINNPRSTAYGLFQFLNKTWKAYGYKKTSDPYLQGVAGAGYIKKRYGSPLGAAAFWRRKKWYNDGGQVPDMSGSQPSIPNMSMDNSQVILPKGAAESAPVFDNAGTLAPGLNLVQNRLGKPEPLRRADQVDQATVGAFRTALREVDLGASLEGMTMVADRRVLAEVVKEEFDRREGRGLGTFERHR